LRHSNEKKNSRLPSQVQTGAPQKAGERLGDDLSGATKRNGGRSLPKNGRDRPAIISGKKHYSILPAHHPAELRGEHAPETSQKSRYPSHGTKKPEKGVRT
jgi:hypothetical protein